MEVSAVLVLLEGVCVGCTVLETMSSYWWTDQRRVTASGYTKTEYSMSGECAMISL